MKPNANLYRLNTTLDFTKSQQEFLEQVGFFNPEPQIYEAIKLFSDVKDVSLSRLITWQGVDEKGRVSNRLFDLQPLPFRHSLRELTHELNERNFQEFLHHTEMDLSSLVNFKVLEVKWFIKLWEDHNRYAPSYAPKRLSNGLKFVQSDNKLTVSFQKVSTSLWLTSDYNQTTVIPLTYENFDLVIDQHVHLTQKYLQNKEK